MQVLTSSDADLWPYGEHGTGWANIDEDVDNFDFKIRHPPPPEDEDGDEDARDTKRRKLDATSQPKVVEIGGCVPKIRSQPSRSDNLARDAYKDGSQQASGKTFAINFRRRNSLKF